LAPWAAHFVYAFELPKEARQVQLSSRFADENAVIIAIEINTLVVFGLCLVHIGNDYNNYQCKHKKAPTFLGSLGSTFCICL